MRCVHHLGVKYFLQSLDVPSGKVEESFLEIHKSPRQGLVLSVVTSPEFLTVKNWVFLFHTSLT